MNLKHLTDNQLNELRMRLLRFKRKHMAFFNNHENRCDRIDLRIVDEKHERNLEFNRRFYDDYRK